MAENSHLDLPVPKSKLEGCQHVAMDIGGSLLKIAYVAQDQSGDKDTVTIKFKSISRHNVTEGLDFIQSQNLDIKEKAAKEIPIQATGNGSYQFAVKIQETLGSKITSLPETKCFVDAFLYLLKNCPEDKIIVAHRAEPLESVKAQTMTILSAFQMAQDLASAGLDTSGIGDLSAFFTPKPLTSTPVVITEDFFPCILAMCGSAIAPMKVHADGKFEQLNMLPRGGAMLLGMGALLTGAKTYDELLSLAARGNHKALDICSSDMLVDAADSSEGFYKDIVESIKTDMLVYNMGKAAGKSRDDFQPEDIAAAYVRIAIADMVSVVFSNTKDTDAKSVYFCGSLINHQFIKDVITEEWTKLSVNGMLLQGKTSPVSAHFLKHGSFLGALGSLLQPTLSK